VAIARCLPGYALNYAGSRDYQSLLHGKLAKEGEEEDGT